MKTLTNTKKRLSIVQIGIGGWGKNHLRHLHDTGKLVAICDTDHVSLTKYGSLYPCLVYNSIDEMLKSCDFDIAFVTTPTSTHYKIAKQLLENGKHVFVEKPFTESISQGEELIKIATENNLKLTCGYIERFNPVTEFIKEVAHEPILLEFHRESKIPSHIKDAGIVLDTMVHDIDTACYLFGSYPVKVQSVKHNIQNGSHDDICVAVLSFPNNKIASLVSNWNTNSKMRAVHATFEHGIIRGDFVKKQIKIIEPDRIITPEIKQNDPLKSEIESFIKCVEDDGTPVVSATHANKITKIALEILNNG